MEKNRNRKFFTIIKQTLIVLKSTESDIKPRKKSWRNLLPVFLSFPIPAKPKQLISTSKSLPPLFLMLRGHRRMGFEISMEIISEQANLKMEFRLQLEQLQKEGKN